MKPLTWRVVFVSAGITALVLAASLRLSREGSRPIQSTEQISDPSVDSLARLETKRRIAHEVLDGRTSLLAAASAFRRLDEHGLPWIHKPECFASAATEDEGYCRWVIGWASTEAPNGQGDEAKNRLQAELAAMLRAGTLHLPDANRPNPGDGDATSRPSSALGN
jgi:hypothetical protein